jgi:hypothetical protein
MTEKKSLVEEAIIQMKNLEESIAENAKGILASTMKEEIKELVKESLSEQDDEIEADVEMDTELPDMGDEDEMDTDNEEMSDDDMDIEDSEETIDLTDKSDEEVLKVFKLMKPEDSITVVKDESGNINVKDGEDEYLIVNESEMDFDDEDFEEEMDEESDIDKIIGKVFEKTAEDEEEIDEESDDEEMYESDEEDMDEESDEIVYEISFDDEDEDEDEEFDYEEMDFDDEDFGEEMDETKLEESKMSIKPKGVGMGSASKFKFAKKPNMSGGFKEKMKEGPKSVGTGKAKFDFKEGENLAKKVGKNKIVKKTETTKEETKEASRTLGSGSKFRKGGLPKPKAHSKFNTAIEESTSNKEVQILKEKNEEYRKALNVFRDKLNEVAVFNSNLAYATRLFTEHSTSKQEKINILRRFDNVSTLKESKNLYKTIKDQLSSSSNDKKTMTESVENKLEKTPTSGSAANLIESKTYENPQFLRMKDLMSKLK